MGNPWIMQIGPVRPHAPTLICFPHAGGGAATFRRWGTTLPDELNVVAVQPPGRENRRHEPCIRDLPTLLDGIAEGIAEYTARPFALFGHSIGALIAFEVARMLRRRGGPAPACLAVSAFPSPDTLVPQPLHKIPDKAILDFLSGLSYFPDGRGSEPELVRELLPVLRADFEVVSDYRFRPEPPFSWPVHVFGGDSDTFVSPQELGKWQEHTAHSFSLGMLGGGHFYLYDHGPEIFRTVAASLPSPRTS